MLALSESRNLIKVTTPLRHAIKDLTTTRTRHLRATFQIANEIAAVKILAGSSDTYMYFFITDEPKSMKCLVWSVLAKCMCHLCK